MMPGNYPDDARELSRRTHITFRTWQKFEIKVTFYSTGQEIP
jgi:hypothetical protein